ncbi:hypothetical protein P154DRAFT_518980 [Amniculicola lignicola CBS 123094]|uniref:JmjC domain-containing protein n=1 Tax=Amniculicola lignicola CBS 123094 TaxID=1392246 RepID=A0A6A5X256_9PLEO|nr:hypothetical protein P154DRAFT_518980 [Amniculicola lignicola CBS 123094]
MPAARPRASFDPIPTDFDVRTFVETSDNFQYADRISYEMIAENGMAKFEKLVLLHVIIGGKPLVIDGFEEILDPWTFTPSWLRDNHGEKVENACNLTTKENIPLTIKHYLKHMGKLTEQFFDGPQRYRDKTRQRIYLKDIDSPPVWHDKLREHIPSFLFYLNDSTGETGGPGALDEAGFRKGRGIARAGDLMSSLPPEMRAENLMCYIGHEGTYTPAHREMCASLGQNIMVNASGTISEDGKPEHPGSSLWFMTETKDRQVVSEYWLSVLGHDIEVENHFAQLIAWKKAPFKTYVVEQRPGDFILIPPLAPHQVWNRGTRTMKIAWNRTTAETLEMAINEALPNSRIVCRDEQYKNKAIIYYTLLKYSGLIKSARSQVELGGDHALAIQHSTKIRQMQRDFKRLFELYKGILLSEMFSPDSREHPEFVAFDSNVTCSYCRSNIFNRFLTCKACKHAFSKELEEPYDVCMDCYCMGRSCACQSGYTWVEQWKWKDLSHKYEEWRAQIIDIDGQMTEKTPLPLLEERRYLGKKTLAEVCQEQLKIRPFVDSNAPQQVEEGSSDDEIHVNEDGTLKKMVKKKSKQWHSKHRACHFCKRSHQKWKMAICYNCDLAYCYGTIFRAHDTMPLAVMENPTWKCPHCRRVCNAGNCRRDHRQDPYEPKGTLLGHDTKKVADPRSVECLVDFSVSNLNFVREDENTGQIDGPLQRRRAEAERAKMDDPEFDDRFRDEHGDDIPRNGNGIVYSPVEDAMGENAYNHDYFGSSAAVDDGFQPNPRMHGDNLDSYYPDADLNGEIPRLGKRGRDDYDEEATPGRNKKKKRQKKQKDETAPAPPKTVSGKQYQKQVEKKLLDEARKEDRYILVAARMKKKSRIVKLYLNPDDLASLEIRQVVERPRDAQQDEEDEPSANGRSILQSDVLPVSNNTGKDSANPKPPTSFRYRVEEDDAYGARKRDRERNKTSKPGRPSKLSHRFEEVTLESDEEMDGGDDGTYRARGGQRGRASAWLARKNEGEEDLPAELPANFRDGLVNPYRKRDRARENDRANRRKTMSEKPKATTRPPGHVSRKSAGNISNEDGIHEDDDQANSALMLAQSPAAAREASHKAEEEKAKVKKAKRLAAEKAAEENMRAKMAIEEWSEDGDLNGFIDGLAAADEREHNEDDRSQDATFQSSPAQVRDGPPQSQNSIFSRPGMSGKNIKVVSAKQNGETGSSSTTMKSINISAPVAAFTSVNKASRRANLSENSESDSEDEIPAKAPPPKSVGRPSLSSMRGLSTAKRGRGRPRKST